MSMAEPTPALAQPAAEAAPEVPVILSELMASPVKNNDIDPINFWSVLRETANQLNSDITNRRVYYNYCYLVLVRGCTSLRAQLNREKLDQLETLITELQYEAMALIKKPESPQSQFVIQTITRAPLTNRDIDDVAF